MKYGLVCNKGQEIFLCNNINDFCVFNAPNDFDGRGKIIEKLKGFVVVAETKWNSPYFLFLKGLDAIKDLRIKYHLDVPVVVVSFILDLNLEPEVSLLHQKRAPFNILLDPSINFCSISNFLDKSIAGKLETLFPDPIDDEILFEDVKKLYNSKSYLNELSHALRKKINDFSKIAQGAEVIFFIRHIFQEIKMVTPQYRHRIQALFERWQNEIETEKPYNFAENLAKRLRDDLDDISRDIDLNPAQELSFPPITVLSIDDDKVDQVILKEKLQTQFNITCICVQSLYEAQEKLETNPEIGVVICDYRFYDRNNRFSRLQCHNLIDALSKFKPKNLNFIILTNYPESLSALFLKRYAGLRRFSKKVLRDDFSFLQFYQAIRDEIKIIELEKAEIFGLHSAFFKYYNAYYNDINYQNYEESINKEVDDYMKKIMSDDYRTLPSLPFQTNFKPGNNFFNLDMFIIKLKARRIVLSLLQLEKFWEEVKKKGKRPNWTSIINVLSRRRLPINKDDGMEKNQENLIINHNLSLSKKLHYGINTPLAEMKILDEEKKWLEYFRQTIK